MFVPRYAALNEAFARDAPALRDADAVSASVVLMYFSVLREARSRDAGALADYAVFPDDAVAVTAVPPGDVVPPRFCVPAVRRGSVSAPHRYVLSSCEMLFPRRI